MLRVALKLLLAAAALAAVWAFVPVGGRTMADRWQRARDPQQFAERAWAELRGHPCVPPRPPAPQRQAAPPRAQARGAAPARPTEAHTPADRKALDQIVSKRLDGR